MTTAQTLQDRLQSLSTVPSEAPAASPTPRNARPNQFDGRCSKCGSCVYASKGLLGPKVNGKWTVEHIECPEQLRTLPSAPRPAAPVGDAPHPGIYTVVQGSGHFTFRVTLQKDDAEFMPGRTLIAILNGRDNTSDYRTVGSFFGSQLRLFRKHQGNQVWTDAINVLVTDPESVLTAKHCIKCNRILSTPESIASGIGPWCAANG